VRGTLAPPAGNPAALAASVDRYEATERAIAAAADELLRVTTGGAGLAVDALNDQSHGARDHLSRARERYRGTRSALRAYTVELVAFHAAATAAIEDDHAARIAAHDAGVDLTEAARHARGAALNPEDQATIDHWQNQVYFARQRRDVADDAMVAAQADYQRAAEALEQAAQRTIALIDAAFDGTNDGWRDHVGHVFADVGSILSTLSEWVRGFFQAVFEAVVEAVALVVRVLLAVVVAVALTIVLIQFLAVALAVLAVVLVIVLAAVAVMVAAGRFAYRTGTVLGVDDLTHIRMVLAALMVACPVLGAFILARVSDELSKPTPKVRRLRPEDLDKASATRALANLESSVPDSIDDFLAQAGAVDTVGGDSLTVVDIARIDHEDGTVAWIVTLPSTKDWVMSGDASATNDLDADLLLLAFPELQSQYEKAALDAMAQAGIGEGEPVLVTGWSLGGILAGHIADTRADGYDYQGVVVAGSPIDHMDISARIPVVQVKHMGDVVHRTDLIDSVPDHGAHVSLWDGVKSGIGVDWKGGPIVSHNAELYRDTLEQHVTANQTLNDDFTEFFVVDDPSHTGAPTIAHTQYAFSE